MTGRLWVSFVAVVTAAVGRGAPVAADEPRTAAHGAPTRTDSERPEATPRGHAPRESRGDLPGSTEVEFRAGAVDIDAEQKAFFLKDDVEVVVDRYRLSADQLSLKRGQYGLEVEGEGWVAFCRCDSAPVTFGFSSAIVAPPTDLLLTDPTVRVAGVPVCWSPYLWLRSPRRPGFLAPSVAWRGPDGLLVGSGLHWPMGRDEQGAPKSELDLRAAGYAEGGFELQGALATRTTSTRLRWDWLELSLLDAQSHGVVPAEGEVRGAWRLDVLRGARALEAAGDLAAVAKPYDRVRATLGVVGDHGALGWGLRALGGRGAAWNEFRSAGPWFSASAGRQIGRGLAADGTLAGGAVRAASGDESLWSVGTGVGGTVHGGGVQFEWRSGGRGVLHLTETASGFGATAGALARVAAPLVRDWGSPESPLWHWVEPFAVGVTDQSGGHDARGLLKANALVGTRFAGVGLRNALESRRTREAVELTTVAGRMWQGQANPENVAAVRVRAQSDFFAASTEAVSQRPEVRLAEVSLRNAVRLGLRDGIHLTGWVDGSRGTEFLDMRRLTDAPWEVGGGTWYPGEGWSSGASLVIPWAKWLVSSVGGAVDIREREMLAANADIAYRHPCGCLAVLAEAQRRLGRPGYDASIAVDLMP